MTAGADGGAAPTDDRADRADGADGAVPGGHRAPAGAPPFPGGIAVSHLRVYASEASDGLAGGTPHCHTACTEAYAVVAGHGRVHTLGGDGFRETPIEAGSFVWFTPGTIHRLVNDSGTLEILVLMQNAGLPEAGDMVITFPDVVLAQPDRYQAAAALPPTSATTAGTTVPCEPGGSTPWRGSPLLDGGPNALARFHRRAAALVQPKVDRWRPVWEAGPLAAAETTGRHLAALAAGDPGHLGAGETHALPPPPGERRYGCCGTLGVFLPA